jgi:hypothetical protein
VLAESIGSLDGALLFEWLTLLLSICGYWLSPAPVPHLDNHLTQAKTTCRLLPSPALRLSAIGFHAQRPSLSSTRDKPLALALGLLSVVCPPQARLAPDFSCNKQVHKVRLNKAYKLAYTEGCRVG